mmetsp:Transcript_28124/g.61578  ORF Transcript_28124/g.61578 Transcript_28124/m.61578 type:complete len:259 (+) Transcript_28124:326-1102(+)
MSTSRFMPSRFTFHCWRSWNAFLCFSSTTRACLPFSTIFTSHSLMPSSLALACAVSTSICASVARMRCSSPLFPALSPAIVSVISLITALSRSSSSVSSSSSAFFFTFSSFSFFVVFSISTLFSQMKLVFSSISACAALSRASASSASAMSISVCFEAAASSSSRASPASSLRHHSFSSASSLFTEASWLSWACRASAWSMEPESVCRTVLPSSRKRSSQRLTVKTCQLLRACSSTSTRSTNQDAWKGGAPLTGAGAL